MEHTQRRRVLLRGHLSILGALLAARRYRPQQRAFYFLADGPDERARVLSRGLVSVAYEIVRITAAAKPGDWLHRRWRDAAGTWHHSAEQIGGQR